MMKGISTEHALDASRGALQVAGRFVRERPVASTVAAAVALGVIAYAWSRR